MIHKTIFSIVLLFVISLVVAQGPPGGGPPEEAITACDGKNSGDVCSFTGRQEEIGTCESGPSGEIACVPEGGPGQSPATSSSASGREVSQEAVEAAGSEPRGFFRRVFGWLARLFGGGVDTDENIIEERGSEIEDSEPEGSGAEDFEVEVDVIPDGLPNYLIDVWDCIDSDITVSDLTTGGDDSLKCSVEVSYTDTEVIIRSNGISPHDLESMLGCCATEQESVWRIPIVPIEDTDGEYTLAAERGPVAFTVAGVAIYGPEEGPGGDAVALQFDYFVEDRQDIEIGLCGGHAGPGGQYHHHFDANCLHWHSETDEDVDWTEYSFDDLIADKHSELIGFALDGYPIYGSFGWDNEEYNGDVREMISSYRLKSSGGQGYNGIDDWEYVEGLGDLDECNGHFAPTPHNPEGFYHYHSTMENGDGKIGFPYFLLCYHGIYDGSQDTAGQGVLGGQQGSSGQGPPPSGGR